MGIALREQVKFASISASAAGDNTIITGVAGKIITVIALILGNNVTTAQSVVFKDGTGGTAFNGPFALSTTGGQLVLPPDPTVDYFQSAVAGNNFVLNLSAATAVGGTVWYVQN